MGEKTTIWWKRCSYLSLHNPDQNSLGHFLCSRFFSWKWRGIPLRFSFEVSRLILLIYRCISAGKIWKFYNLNKLIALYISLQRGMTTSGLNCWQRWHPRWCINLPSSCIRSVFCLLICWFYIFYHVALDTNLENDFITQTFLTCKKWAFATARIFTFPLSPPHILLSWNCEKIF